MNENLIQPLEEDPYQQQEMAFWHEVGKDLVRGSVATLDKTARQIIIVAGILEGLYFHAITFSNLRKLTMDCGSMWVYLLPILLLLISLIFALGVFIPDRYRLNLRASEASKLIYKRIVTKKYRFLMVASLFLILGIVAIFLAIYSYLVG